MKIVRRKRIHVRILMSCVLSLLQHYVQCISWTALLGEDVRYFSGSLDGRTVNLFGPNARPKNSV
jgi:hypothetical protein